MYFNSFLHDQHNSTYVNSCIGKSLLHLGSQPLWWCTTQKATHRLCVHKQLYYLHNRNRKEIQCTYIYTMCLCVREVLAQVSVDELINILQVRSKHSYRHWPYFSLAKLTTKYELCLLICSSLNSKCVSNFKALFQFWVTRETNTNCIDPAVFLKS